MALISAIAFVCQNILTEADGVSSAIRIVEVFMLPRGAADPERKALPPVGMALYINIRLTADDDSPHTITFTLTRPNGESKTLPVMENTPFSAPKYPGTDKTISVVGHIGVEPRQVGRHDFAINFDEQKVATAFFTLVEMQSSNEPDLAPSPDLRAPL
jgi:hypothetical protein